MEEEQVDLFLIIINHYYVVLSSECADGLIVDQYLSDVCRHSPLSTPHIITSNAKSRPSPNILPSIHVA